MIPIILGILYLVTSDKKGDTGQIPNNRLTNTVKYYPTDTPKPAATATPYYRPTNTVRYYPTNTPKPPSVATPYFRPTNTVRKYPTNTPKPTATSKLPMPRYYKEPNLSEAMYYYWEDVRNPSQKILAFFMSSNQKIGGFYLYKSESEANYEFCLVGQLTITHIDNTKRRITISDGNESLTVDAVYELSGSYYFSTVGGVSINSSLVMSSSSMNGIKKRIISLASQFYQ